MKGRKCKSIEIKVRNLSATLTFEGDVALVDGNPLEHLRALVLDALEDGQLEHLLETRLGCLAALRAADDDHLLEGVAGVEQLLQQNLAHEPRRSSDEYRLILIVFLHWR